MERVAVDLPQTKREKDYRDQRDRLARMIRALLADAQDERGWYTCAEGDADRVLHEIYGSPLYVYKHQKRVRNAGQGKADG